MGHRRQQFGQWGETLAAHFLESQGMRIVDRNFRAGHGEIDLICQDGETLVFVEVKTRRSANYGPPESSITRSKQRQLYNVATAYIQQHPELDCDFRFDVVVIDGTPQSHTIRYYPNAFML